MQVDYVVIQTTKKNSTADISTSFMLFTIYKEIQIGSDKLLNQYKQKTDKIWNMTTFEKISGKLASLHYIQMKILNTLLCII